jgi:hypothetical protein
LADAAAATTHPLHFVFVHSISPLTSVTVCLFPLRRLRLLHLLRRHLLDLAAAGSDRVEGVRRVFEAALSPAAGGTGVISSDEFAAALSRLSFGASLEQAQVMPPLS